MIDAINAGARFYVVKPFDMESVANKIATAIAEARKKEETPL